MSDQPSNLPADAAKRILFAMTGDEDWLDRLEREALRWALDRIDELEHEVAALSADRKRLHDLLAPPTCRECGA